MSFTHGSPSTHIWTLAAGSYIREWYVATCHVVIVLVSLQVSAMAWHPVLLAVTFTVNQEIQLDQVIATSTVKIHSGIESSVKVNVAVMANLRGLVWSYQTQQVTTLRCAFAVATEHGKMMFLFNYWRSMFNKWDTTLACDHINCYTLAIKISVLSHIFTVMLSRCALINIFW